MTQKQTLVFLTGLSEARRPTLNVGASFNGLSSRLNKKEKTNTHLSASSLWEAAGPDASHSY